MIRPLALAALALACACAPSRPAVSPFAAVTDPGVKEDCAMTVRTCSRCHELDRALGHRAGSPRGWSLLVERMRRTSAGAMSRTEASAAARCLVFRELGRPGLLALAGRAR